MTDHSNNDDENTAKDAALTDPANRCPPWAQAYWKKNLANMLRWICSEDPEEQRKLDQIFADFRKLSEQHKQ